MMWSDELEKKLEGRRILWRPGALEHIGSGRAFDDLLVGCGDSRMLPDVWLRTDDRCWGDGAFPADREVRSFESEAGEVRSVRFRLVKEYRPLDGFRGVLHMRADDAAAGSMAPGIGRVMEYQVACNTRSFGMISRTVVFAAVESLEFAMRFLIPRDIRIAALYQRFYHRGFNANFVPGGLMLRLVRPLGARWYFSDSGGVRPILDEDECPECFQAFPALSAFPDAALFPVPEFDPPPASGGEAGDDAVKCHLAGATQRDAEALAEVIRG